jgi:DNA-binding NarL/FixJ family response regulator
LIIAGVIRTNPVMRILIIDDNEAVRRGVKDLLSSETSWEVCGEARDGMEGIEKARELQPDVILLDISMPGMSGWEVARRLRQDSRHRAILIMSQNDASQLLPSAVAAGADGCVDKSRLSTELLAVIKNIQSRRG